MRSFPASARMCSILLAGALALACATSIQSESWAKSPSPKPTRNKKLERQIAIATDGVQAAVIKVQEKRDAYERAQAKSVRAAAAYQAAVGRSAAAHRRALDVRAQYVDAVAVSRSSAVSLTRATGVLRTTDVKYQQMVRGVYMSGSALLQLGVVLDTLEPADLAVRIEGFNALGETQNARLLALTHARNAKAERLAIATANQRAVARLSQQVTAVDKQAAQSKAAAARALAASKSAKQGAKRSLSAATRMLKQAKRELAQLKASQRGIDSSSRRYANGVRPGSLAWPVIGHTRISSIAGSRKDPISHSAGCHAGIDVPASTGTPIHAAASGIVITAGAVRGYGNMTLIAHGGGMATLYGHQSKILVRKGQHVVRNQVIGKVGSTGWSTGPHLHFEVRLAGQPYNPLGWFGQSRKPVACYHRR